jgi:hypothetical protein
MLEAWTASPGPRQAVGGRSTPGLRPSGRGSKSSGKETGKPLRTGPPLPASGSKRPSATRPRRTLPLHKCWPPAQRRSARRPRRTSGPPACTSGQQHQGSATCASTSDRQHGTGPPPWRTGSEPNVLSHFCLSLDGRGLLRSATSQATAWPHSGIGLSASRANVSVAAPAMGPAASAGPRPNSARPAPELSPPRARTQSAPRPNSVRPAPELSPPRATSGRPWSRRSRRPARPRRLPSC